MSSELEIWRRWFQYRILGSRPTAIFLGVCCFLVLGLVIFKFQGDAIIDQHIGYRFKGPGGWAMTVSEDRREYLFHRYRGPRPDNSIIRFTTELGNPYGTTAFEYLLNGLLPQLARDPETGEPRPIRLLEDPVVDEYNGVEWAVARFYAEAHDLGIAAVAYNNDYVYILQLRSWGDNRKRDEKIFLKILNNTRIRGLNYENKIMKYYEEEVLKEEPARE